MFNRKVFKNILREGHDPKILGEQKKQKLRVQILHDSNPKNFPKKKKQFSKDLKY
jgi:hypothetical protein